MKRRVLMVLVFLWMILIFVFSAQPAKESTDMSRFVGYEVGELFISDFENWPEPEQNAFAEKIDHPVRKCAHASEYALLAILIMLLMGSYGVTGKRRLCFCLICVAVYAATDEFHQLFVPGRSGQLTDVLIDTAGGMMGCVIFVLAGKAGKRLSIRRS